MQKDGLAGPCVCVDDESLPFFAGNPAGESGGGNAVVPNNVDDAFQCAAPAERTPFSRALQSGSPTHQPPLVPSASSVVVDAQERRYFQILGDYIHLNPVRARMVSLEQRLFDFPWSSYPLYVAKKGRSPWFEPRVVLGEAGLDDSAAGRRSYAQRMRERAVEELSGTAEAPELAEVRRGWCMGGEGFRERMLRLLDAAGEKLGRRRTSSMEAGAQRDHGLAGARRLLEAGLRVVGLEAGQLAGLPKGDARKAAIAAMIRTHTAVPSTWIAKELGLGHVSRVSHCVKNAPADLLAKLEKDR